MKVDPLECAVIDLEMAQWSSTGPGVIDLLPVCAQAAAMAWYQWRMDPEASPSVSPVTLADLCAASTRPKPPPDIPAVRYDLPIDDPRWGNR